MKPLFAVEESKSWEDSYSAMLQERAIRALEEGMVIFCPNLSFSMAKRELKFLDPKMVDGSKNVSYDPKTAAIGGTGAAGIELQELRGLLGRFAVSSWQLLHQLFPAYREGIQQGRTSLRPVEIAGRATSWRKDDTRLHVDSFPSMPTGGKRILRVFSNVNNENRPRVWRIGGAFDAVARRFQSSLIAPTWGSRLPMYVLRITKSIRSPYDHYMLQLHDLMKEDQEYQSHGEQFTHSFPAGSTWIVYTDQVPHAAMSGIHQLEQTFYVPVSSLRNEASAPIRVLEGLMRRKLAA